MHNDIVLNLIMKGHFHLKAKEDFIHIEPIINKIKWIQDAEETYQYTINTDKVQLALQKTAEHLANKYVKHLDKGYKIGYKSIWNGTEISSCNWHNDLKEGPNLCFLMYCNDINENCGGHIEFRKSATKEVTGSISPKKYDVVIGSQELQWEHRVSPFLCGPMERITINVGFYIKWT